MAKRYMSLEEAFNRQYKLAGIKPVYNNSNPAIPSVEEERKAFWESWKKVERSPLAQENKGLLDQIMNLPTSTEVPQNEKLRQRSYMPPQPETVPAADIKPITDNTPLIPVEWSVDDIPPDHVRYQRRRDPNAAIEQRWETIKSKIDKGGSLTPEELQFASQYNDGAKERAQGTEVIREWPRAIAKSFQRGTSGFLSSVADLPKLFNKDSKGFESVSNLASAIEPEQFVVKGGPVLNTAAEFSESLPSNLALMGAAFGAGAGTKALQGTKAVAKYLPKVAGASKLPGRVAALVSSALESGTEGASTYAQAKAIGKSEDEAIRAGRINAAANLPITLGTDLALQTAFDKALIKAHSPRAGIEQYKKDFIAKFGDQLPQEQLNELAEKYVKENASKIASEGLIGKALGKTGLKQATKDAIAKNLVRAGAYALNQAGESVEEMEQTISNNLALGLRNDPEDLKHAAFMGALNGIVMGGARHGLSKIGDSVAKAGNNRAFNKAIKEGTPAKFVSDMAVDAANYENVANNGATSSAMRPNELYDYAKKRQQVINERVSNGEAIDPNEAKALNQFITRVDKADASIAQNAQGGAKVQPEASGNIAAAASGTAPTANTEQSATQTPVAETPVATTPQTSTAPQVATAEQTAQQTPAQPPKQEKAQKAYPTVQESDRAKVSDVTFGEPAEKNKDGYTRRQVTITTSKGKKTTYFVDTKDDGQYVVRQGGRIVARNNAKDKSATTKNGVIVAEETIKKFNLPQYNVAQQATPGTSKIDNYGSLASMVDENGQVPTQTENTPAVQAETVLNDDAPANEPLPENTGNIARASAPQEATNQRDNFPHSADSPTRFEYDVNFKLKEIDDIINRPTDGKKPNAKAQALYREELEDVRGKLLAARGKIKALRSNIDRRNNTDAKKYGNVVTQASDKVRELERDIQDVLLEAQNKISFVSSKKNTYTAKQAEAQQRTTQEPKPVIKNAISSEAFESENERPYGDKPEVRKEYNDYETEHTTIERNRDNDAYYTERVENVAREALGDSRIHSAEDVYDKDVTAITGKQIPKKVKVQGDFAETHPTEMRDAYQSEYDRLREEQRAKEQIDYNYLNFLQEKLGLYNEDKAEAIQRRKDISSWFNDRFKKSGERSKITFADKLINDYQSEKNALIAKMNEVGKKASASGLSAQERKALAREEADLRKGIETANQNIEDISRIRDSVQNAYDKKVAQTKSKKEQENTPLTLSGNKESDTVSILERKLHNLKQAYAKAMDYSDIDDFDNPDLRINDIVSRQNSKIESLSKQIETLEQEVEKAKLQETNAQLSNNRAQTRSRDEVAAEHSTAINSAINDVFGEFKETNPAPAKKGERKTIDERYSFATAGLSKDAWNGLPQKMQHFLQNILADFGDSNHKNILDFIKEKTAEFKEARYKLQELKGGKELPRGAEAKIDALLDLINKKPSAIDGQIMALDEAISFCQKYKSHFPQQARDAAAGEHFLAVERVLRKVAKLIDSAHQDGVDIVGDLKATLTQSSPLGAWLKGVRTTERTLTSFADTTTLSQAREGNGKETRVVSNIDTSYDDGDIKRPRGVKEWEFATEKDINELSEARSKSSELWDYTSSLDTEELRKIEDQLNQELADYGSDMTVTDSDERALEAVFGSVDRLKNSVVDKAQDKAMRSVVGEQNHLRSFLKAIANNSKIPQPFRDFCQSILDEESNGPNGEALMSAWDEVKNKRWNAKAKYDTSQKNFYDQLMVAKTVFDNNPGNREVLENALGGLKSHEFITKDRSKSVKVTEIPTSAGSRTILAFKGKDGKMVNVEVARNSEGKYVYKYQTDGVGAGKEYTCKSERAVVQKVLSEQYGIKLGGGDSNISLERFENSLNQNMELERANVRSGKDHIEAAHNSDGYDAQAEEAAKNDALIDAATRWANKNIVSPMEHPGDPRYFAKAIPSEIRLAYKQLSDTKTKYDTKVSAAKTLWNYSKLKEQFTPESYIQHLKEQAKAQKAQKKNGGNAPVVKNRIDSRVVTDETSLAETQKEPRQELTVESVKNMFGEGFAKKMTVEQRKDGSFLCKLPWGREFVITPNAEVEYDYESLKEIYGEEKADKIKNNPEFRRGGIILSKVPIIQLADSVENVSESTLKHEITHMALATVLTPGERRALFNYFRDKYSESERDKIPADKVEEDICNAMGEYAQKVKADAKQKPKTWPEKLFAKALDFWRKAKRLAKIMVGNKEARIDKIFEDINTGKVFDRNFSDVTMTENGYVQKGTPNTPAYVTKINRLGLKYGTFNPVRVYKEHLPDNIFDGIYQMYKTAILDRTNPFGRVFGKEVHKQLLQRYTRAGVGRAEFNERVLKPLRECGCIAEDFWSKAKKRKANERFEAVDAILFYDRMGALCENNEKGLVTVHDYEKRIAKRKQLLKDKTLSSADKASLKEDIALFEKAISSIKGKRQFIGKKIGDTDDVTSSKYYYDRANELRKQFPEVEPAVRAAQEAGRFVLDELYKCGRISEKDYNNLIRTGKNYVYLGRYQKDDVKGEWNKWGFINQATSINDVLSQIDGVFDGAETPIHSFRDSGGNEHTLPPITQTALLMNKAMQAVSLQKVHNEMIKQLHDNKAVYDGLFGEIAEGKKVPEGCTEFYMYENGEKKRFYILNGLKEFVDAAQVNLDTDGNFVSKITRWLSKIVYFGATQNHIFAEHNMLGDSWQAATSTKGFYPLYNTVKHLCSAWIQDDKYWDYIKHGGQDESWATPNGVREWFKSPHDSDGANIKERFGKAFSFLSQLVEAGEAATRMGRYDLILNEKIKEYKKSHDDNAPTGDELEEIKFEAGYDSDDNLIFSRQGAAIKSINNTLNVPFLSANIGGTYGGLKHINKNTYKRWLVTSFLAYSLPAITNFLAWHRTPELREKWKNKEGWQKYGYWSIPLKDTEIRFRIRNFNGFLFYGNMMRVLDTVFDKADGMEDFMSSLGDALLPNLAPVLFTLPYEMLSGRSLYYNRPFDSAADGKVSPQNRWNERTAKTYIALSKLIGITPVLKNIGFINQSPKTLQGIGRSLTGAGGNMAVSVIDKGAKHFLPDVPERDKKWYEKGMTKAFIGDALGLHNTNNDTGYEQRFRKGLEKYTQDFNNYKLAVQDTGKAPSFSENKDAVLANRTGGIIQNMQHIERDINKKRSELNKLARSTRITSEEKTRRMANIEKEIVRLSKNGNRLLERTKERQEALSKKLK